MTENTMRPDADPCLRIQEDLPLLGEGILRSEEESALKAHLLGCADCRSEAETLTELKAAYPKPPKDLELRILSALLSSADGEDKAENHEGLAQVRPLRRSWHYSGWGTGALAASLLLAFVAGIGGGRFLTSDAPLSGLDPLAFVDPDLDGWAEEWFVAGAPLLEALSDETLYLLAMEMNP